MADPGSKHAPGRIPLDHPVAFHLTLGWDPPDSKFAALSEELHSLLIGTIHDFLDKRMAVVSEPHEAGHPEPMPRRPIYCQYRLNRETGELEEVCVKVQRKSGGDN